MERVIFYQKILEFAFAFEMGAGSFGIRNDKTATIFNMQGGGHSIAPKTISANAASASP